MSREYPYRPKRRPHRRWSRSGVLLVAVGSLTFLVALVAPTAQLFGRLSDVFVANTPLVDDSLLVACGGLAIVGSMAAILGAVLLSFLRG